MKRADPRRTLLVIDDDSIFAKAVSHYFAGDTIDVLSARTGAEGLKMCATQRIDIVLLDQKLPDGRGVDLCTSILSHNEQTKIIFITAYPSLDNAVDAIKVGAHDYLSKPFEMRELELSIDQVLRTLDLEKMEQVQRYRDSKEREGTVLIGRHGGLKEAYGLVKLAASSDSPVLITGETGAGKNVVAKTIHHSCSSECTSPFLSVNCAALPENLIEAELFGYEKGAFTGAVAAKKGIFEMAAGGTLLLDEIGTLSSALQSKLLGVLDDKKIRKLGGNSLRPVDVRIMAATNLDIERAVEERTFREDLYYRLNVIRIHVPPLRERRQDILLLCRFFVQQLFRDFDLELPDSEMERLQRYHWPGNVRELKNIIERSIILRKGSVLSPSKLLGSETLSGRLVLDGSSPEQEAQRHLSQSEKLVTLEEIEKNYIRHTLTSLSGNRTRAAKSLRISRATLLRKMKTYGLC